MKHFMHIIAAALILGIPICDAYSRDLRRHELCLHYDKAADFFEEAIVMGNGSQGAIIYGGTWREQISLNDMHLWTGEPEKEVYNPDGHKYISEIRAALDKEDYRLANELQKKVQGHFSQNYQPLGQLVIHDLDHMEDDSITSYHRHLDISDATASVSFLKNGKLQCRDYFFSAPDSAMVIRLYSEDGINALISMDSQLPHSSRSFEGEIHTDGYAAYHSYPGYNKATHHYDPERGIHFHTIVKAIVPETGTVDAFPSGEIRIKDTKEALIFIVNASSFNGFDKDPFSEGKDYQRIACERMKKVSSKSYENLLKTHISDYRNLFDRVSLYLGDTEEGIAELPTDRQLLLYTDKKQRNPELETLYFQYGRYLLISCSRTPAVPANLQGLWNEYLLPPWSSNYTTNINMEENYWAAETGNLGELHFSLLDFLKNVSKTGAETAKAYYGIQRGWCMAHNSDIWAMSCPVGLGTGDPSWANWNMAGAWASTHIWEHYLFSMDKDFLREYYPVLKGAAEFCLDWLIEKDGFFMTSPSTSPENYYVTPDGYAGPTLYGGTADLGMIRECLLDARAAAKVLKTDSELIKEIDEKLDRLAPYKIGAKGNLQEWYHDWEDQDPRHRHQSHLFGLYPGHHISLSATPELARACARTLDLKGDKTTGWSTGWRVNLLARLRDSEGAYHIYRTLLKYISPDNYEGDDARRGGGTYPNLLDAHSPFQIDGNFGGCAGVMEMLMQSTAEEIHLLPALPQEWKDGRIKGICARGGFVIEMEWKDSKVVSLTVTSRSENRTTIHYNGQKKQIRMKAGESRKII